MMMNVLLDRLHEVYICDPFKELSDELSVD